MARPVRHHRRTTTRLVTSLGLGTTIAMTLMTALAVATVASSVGVLALT